MSHLFGGGGGSILGVVGAIAGALLAPETGGASLALTYASLGGLAGTAIGTVAGMLSGGGSSSSSSQQASPVSPTQAPTPLPTPTPAAAPPTTATPSVQAAADQTAQDNASAAGRSSTLLTSGLGASDQVTTAKKTLLGS